MTNPWLDIPEADYVGHMSSPSVGQQPVLGRLLGDVLEAVRPAAVLLLGGSTGSGLEHIDPAVTARVVVIDINPTYLGRLRERFPNPPYELDVRSGDVADVELGREVYDLVHAGLILEYVQWPPLLPRVASALRPGGVFSVIPPDAIRFESGGHPDAVHQPASIGAAVSFRGTDGPRRRSA